MKSSLSEYANNFAFTGEKLNIIEFAESKYGCGLKLYGAQKFFLKLFTNLELDNTIKSIKIKDKFGENIVDEFTELEYYKYLLLDGRLSCSYNELRDNHHRVLNYMLCMGRRASKSLMISVYVAYRLYELLLHKCPQEYLGVPASSKMGITFVGLSQDSSSQLYDTFLGVIKDSIFFKKHIKIDPAKHELRFWSLKDLETIEKGNAGVKAAYSFEVSAVPITSGVRGANNIIVVFDEFAHFAASAHSTKDNPMDKFIYEALAPSVSAYRDPQGNPFGRVFMISSPNGKNNQFFKDFEVSFEKPIYDTYTLAMRAPTWEINFNVDSAFLKSTFNKSRSTYDQEYAAEFLEGGLNWIKDLDALYFCVDAQKEHTNDICMDLAKPHFMGLDFGLSRDATVAAVCHYEPVYRKLKSQFLKESFSYNEELKEQLQNDSDFIDIQDVYVIDYLQIYKCGQPPFEKANVLDIDIILDGIEFIFKKFPIHYGIYDQWSGTIISQNMEKRGLSKKIEMITHTQTINDSQYKNFSQLLHTKKIVFPNHLPLIKELLNLKVENKPNDIISVEAVKGHDDIFDAIIRSLYIAYNYKTKPEALSGIISSNGSFFSKKSNNSNTGQSQMIKNMYHRRSLAPTPSGRP